jgi:hypothetical protein
MYFDREEHRLYFAHSSMFIQSPFWIDFSQLRLALGFTCPRHRRLLKANLGVLGWMIPYREWNDAGDGFVSFWSEENANGQYERTHAR